MSFTIEAFQNRHLLAGQSRVDAILSVTAGGPASAAAVPTEVMLGIIVDTSGSMAGDRLASVKRAVSQAIAPLDAAVMFFVVGFHAEARVIAAPAHATPAAKQAAEAALHDVSAKGGTAMSRGLAAARALFAQRPDAIRQALFLTDGKNENEPVGAVGTELVQCAGVFQCDCWGVGTDWQVGEVQQIAHALLGKASLIPEPEGIAAAFATALRSASSKAFKDVRLRLWTPRDAQILFVKQVNPLLDELTHRGRETSPQVREYLTGAWSQGESRDFHVAVKVKSAQVGDEMLAARPSIAFHEAMPGGWVEREVKPAEARLFATWTSDARLSARVDDQVAHYTGQSELAAAIQGGLAEQARGNAAAATQLLGRAVQLAHQSNSQEMTQRLQRVVDVVDPVRGTIRLKANASRAASMDLELESRTTRRSRRTEPPPDGAGTP
jgi:hypothetical protein